MIKKLIICIMTIVIFSVSEKAYSKNNDLDLIEIESYEIDDDYNCDELADPFEPINRMIFGLNYHLDFLFIKPVAHSYRTLVPEVQRKKVRNVINNTFEPLTMVNSLLQLDFGNAATSFWRFVLNTTFGLGGLYDFAGKYANLQQRPEDFGQTLGKWGVGGGFYMVLPIIGPSSLRHTTGRFVDLFIDPLNYATEEQSISAARYSLHALNVREKLLDVTDDIEKNSLDFYLSIKSLYEQNRMSMVRNGKRNF